jgi:hypothetical protein
VTVGTAGATVKHSLASGNEDRHKRAKAYFSKD